MCVQCWSGACCKAGGHRYALLLRLRLCLGCLDSLGLCLSLSEDTSLHDLRGSDARVGEAQLTRNPRLLAGNIDLASDLGNTLRRHQPVHRGTYGTVLADSLPNNQSMHHAQH